MTFKINGDKTGLERDLREIDEILTMSIYVTTYTSFSIIHGR
jgi:hypothetical protein